MASHYSFFTTNEIKPKGWIKNQLEIQLKGLTGNLYKFWPDIKDSKWIGGNCEGWERVPYWLDGAIPLAYLLDEKELKTAVKKYIDAILSKQCDDGWICPCTVEERKTYDTWAVHLISKVLVRYYECSGDKRVPDALYKCLKNYYNLLSSGEIKLFDWGKYRWFEAFPAINFLYNIYKEDWLKELGKIIKEQGADYTALEPLWTRPLNVWRYETHIVNLTQMLKSEVLSNDILGLDYKNLAGEYYGILDKYNGTAVGLITGDECLSGISPIQGTELCAVVEEMDSLGQLYAYTSDGKWADLLEKVAFNALPATISDDMCSHQYDQMANQTSSVPFPGKSLFRTNNSEAHVFGLEPNYGCCTANMHQGYPKLVLSSILKSNDGIVSVIPLPCVLNTKYGDADVTVEVQSEYPFKTAFRYIVTASKANKMCLGIRIPAGAFNLTVNGKKRRNTDIVKINSFAEGKTVIDVSYDFKAVLSSRPEGMKCVTRGPIVYALHLKENWERVEYTRDGVERKYPFCDYRVTTSDKWNYAFASKELEYTEREVSSTPFSSKNPPAAIRTKLVPIEWQEEDGYENICAKHPTGTKATGEAIEAELVPYGCAKLRMTEMPFVK